jgi:predicted metal-dependent RNase
MSDYISKKPKTWITKRPKKEWVTKKEKSKNWITKKTPEDLGIKNWITKKTPEDLGIMGYKKGGLVKKGKPKLAKRGWK